MGNGSLGSRGKSQHTPGDNTGAPRLLLPAGGVNQVSVLEDEGVITSNPSLSRTHGHPEAGKGISEDTVRYMSSGN